RSDRTSGSLARNYSTEAIFAQARIGGATETVSIRRHGCTLFADPSPTGRKTPARFAGDRTKRFLRQDLLRGRRGLWLRGHGRSGRWARGLRCMSGRFLDRVRTILGGLLRRLDRVRTCFRLFGPGLPELLELPEGPERDVAGQCVFGQRGR